MTECTHEHFVCDGQLKPVNEFLEYFRQPHKYIYEVFRVQDDIPVFIEDHIERLWKTAELERIELPFSKNQLLFDIYKLIQSNPDGDGNIKILISLLVHSPIKWLLYFNPHQYPTVEQFQNGVSVSLFKAIRENPNAKVMDVALRSATEIAKAIENAYEVLLVDRDGYITEGSRSNVFFIKNDQLITPPVQNVLEGVTRKHIMKLCIENQMPVSEQVAHHQSLEEMEAVFITGTSRRVLPVSRIGNYVYNVSHPIIKKLQQLFENHVQQYIAWYKAQNTFK